jgi:hypothetical protein
MMYFDAAPLMSSGSTSYRVAPSPERIMITGFDGQALW